jgi:putative transposase
MPRKLRLEYPGARYHIINRGNYRSDVFATDSTKAAFEKCLFEAAENWGWLVYAFVLMRNHFHLAIATPQANLVVGMQWLESTFANRFNRLRREHGHLFQGRYRALLIGGDAALGEVCDYIHLNPVRPKIVTMAELPNFRYSSFWYGPRPALRPVFLQLRETLAAVGPFEDDSVGWANYSVHLTNELEAERPGQRRYVHLTDGWAIGSDAFKANLIEKYAPIGYPRAWSLPGAMQMREAQWQIELNKALLALKRTSEDARVCPKSEVWKLSIATWMRDTTRAENKWLSAQLNLGSPSVISRNLAKYRCRYQAGDPSWRMLTSSFAT